MARAWAPRCRRPTARPPRPGPTPRRRRGRRRRGRTRRTRPPTRGRGRCWRRLTEPRVGPGPALDPAAGSTAWTRSVTSSSPVSTTSTSRFGWSWAARAASSGEAVRRAGRGSRRRRPRAAATAGFACGSTTRRVAPGRRGRPADPGAGARLVGSCHGPRISVEDVTRRVENTVYTAVGLGILGLPAPPGAAAPARQALDATVRQVAPSRPRRRTVGLADRARRVAATVAARPPHRRRRFARVDLHWPSGDVA